MLATAGNKQRGNQRQDRAAQRQQAADEKHQRQADNKCDQRKLRVMAQTRRVPAIHCLGDGRSHNRHDQEERADLEEAPHLFQTTAVISGIVDLAPAPEGARLPFVIPRTKVRGLRRSCSWSFRVERKFSVDPGL